MILMLLLVPLIVTAPDWVTLLTIIGIPTIISSVFLYINNRNTLKSHKPVQDSEITMNSTTALGQTIERLSTENTRLNSMNESMINRVKALEDRMGSLQITHEREITQLREESNRKLNQLRDEASAQFAKYDRRHILVKELIESGGIAIPDWFDKLD